MKTVLFFVFVLLCIVPPSVVGQESSEKHFYLNATGEIKTSYFTNIKDSIELTERNLETKGVIGIPAAILGIAISELVPILVEKVGLLAYNPKKYISEYGTSYLFDIENLRTVDNLQKIRYTRTGLSNNSKTLLSTFTFDVIDLPTSSTQDLKGYTAIALESYQNKYTKVKLKNSGQKMNVIAEVALTYYDTQNQKQELKLQPYKLPDMKPKGQEGMEISITKKKRNYQVIPPMKFIETLTIKIIEVNARKKDWDAYLEIFNSQKGNLSGLLIDQLK